LLFGLLGDPNPIVLMLEKVIVPVVEKVTMNEAVALEVDALAVKDMVRVTPS